MPPKKKTPAKKKAPARKKTPAKKQQPIWLDDFQAMYPQADDQIRIIAKGGFSRKQLVEMTHYSQPGKVLTEIWNQITCDLETKDGEQYRFHTSGDHYVIKRRTYGPDGNSYAGWSFHEKFEKSREGKEIALETWIELCAESDDWNQRGIDAGTMNPGGEKEVVEEVTPQPIEKSNVPSMEHLAVMINNDYAAYQQLEQEAAHRSVRIGLSLERAKILSEHGQFEDWCEENLTVSKTHRWRCRKLAAEFLKQLPSEEHKQFLEWVGGEIEDLEMDEPVKQFVGEKTQLELFDEFGISAPKQKSLPAPKKPKAKLKPGETQAHRDAAELIYPLQDELQELVIGDRRVVQHLTVKELQTLEADLVDALKNVRTLIKAG